MQVQRPTDIEFHPSSGLGFSPAPPLEFRPMAQVDPAAWSPEPFPPEPPFLRFSPRTQCVDGPNRVSKLRGPQDSSRVSTKTANSLAPGSTLGFRLETPCAASATPAIASDFASKAAPLSRALIIEVCAGSAVLSKAVKKPGMRALPMDKTSKRASGIKIISLDLTKSGQLDTLIQLLRSEKDNILRLWIAPPCGTASRAREKPLPPFVKAGLKVPVPLRSDAFPDGLGKLSATDKQRGEESNQLYEQVTTIVREALKLQLHVAIENPTNSLYWETSFFAPLKEVLHAFYVTFHNCCHGGARPKLTSVWTTLSCLQALEARCQNDHEHASRKPKLVRGRMVFPTHEEASYPLKFCATVATLLKEHALQKGFQECDSLSQQLMNNSQLRTRVAIGILPRGGKTKPLVPEFGPRFGT